MYAIHYFEDKIELLNVALRRIPTVDESVKIKGRKGKVIKVEKMSDTKYFVFVEIAKTVEKSNTNFRGISMKKK